MEAFCDHNEDAPQRKVGLPPALSLAALRVCLPCLVCT